MKFNYPILRSCDMVVCAGKSPFATVTRIVTSGWKHFFDRKIAVHTGIIFELEGQKLIAEMQPKGLELNSMERYAKPGGRRWVIAIRRNPAFDSDYSRTTVQETIALDLRRTLEYDYKGLLEFVSKRIKDNKKRAYCSEYYYQLTKDFVGYPESFDTKVSPYDLQKIGAGYIDVPGFAV